MRRMPFVPSTPAPEPSEALKDMVRKFGRIALKPEPERNSSETLEELRRSRDYQRERVGKVKIARNRLADGLEYWRERAMKAETALGLIISADTVISDGGKVHDHGRCAEIAIAALSRS